MSFRVDMSRVHWLVACIFASVCETSICEEIEAPLGGIKLESVGDDLWIEGAGDRVKVNVVEIPFYGVVDVVRGNCVISKGGNGLFAQISKGDLVENDTLIKVGKDCQLGIDFGNKQYVDFDRLKEGGVYQFKFKE